MRDLPTLEFDAWKNSLSRIVRIGRLPSLVSCFRGRRVSFVEGMRYTGLYLPDYSELGRAKRKACSLRVTGASIIQGLTLPLEPIHCEGYLSENKDVGQMDIVEARLAYEYGTRLYNRLLRVRQHVREYKRLLRIFFLACQAAEGRLGRLNPGFIGRIQDLHADAVETGLRLRGTIEELRMFRTGCTYAENRHLRSDICRQTANDRVYSLFVYDPEDPYFITGVPRQIKERHFPLADVLKNAVLTV
jgi:hypothetical protein